ncbi:hypothetical protein GCM10023259_001060 [Thermocatellispora tengchongensis]
MTCGAGGRFQAGEEPVGGSQGGVGQGGLQERQQPVVVPRGRAERMVPQLPGEVLVVGADPALQGEDAGQQRGMLSAASRRASVARPSRWFFSQR